MVMVSSALLALAMAAPQAGTASADVDLFCTGRGDRYVANAPRARFNTAIRIRIAGGSGQALVPDDMLADDDARGWHQIKKLAVSPVAITGKIEFSWIFAPVMSLDRDSGQISVTGSLANFQGTCRRYDARTMRMPAPSVRAAAVAPPRPAGAAPGSRNDWARPAAAAPGTRSDWARPATAARPKVRAPGTFVLAKFKGGANWYPAQVMRVSGNLVTVQYGGGSQESLPANLIYDLNWKVGTYIECKLIAGGPFQRVTIAGMRTGYALDVVTDGGKRYASRMQSCRTVAR